MFNQSITYPCPRFLLLAPKSSKTCQLILIHPYYVAYASHIMQNSLVEYWGFINYQSYVSIAIKEMYKPNTVKLTLSVDNGVRYSISQEICTRFLLYCALLWLYIDWFSHIHQAYFTGTSASEATLMNMDKYFM